MHARHATDSASASGPRPASMPSARPDRPLMLLQCLNPDTGFGFQDSRSEHVTVYVPQCHLGI